MWLATYHEPCGGHEDRSVAQAAVHDAPHIGACHRPGVDWALTSDMACCPECPGVTLPLLLGIGWTYSLSPPPERQRCHLCRQRTFGKRQRTVHPQIFQWTVECRTSGAVCDGDPVLSGVHIYYIILYPMLYNSAISSSSPTPGTWASYPHRREAEVSSCHICQRRARRGRRGWSDQCSRSWGQLRSWRRPPGGPYPPPPHWACHMSCSPDSDTPRPGRDSGGWSKPSWERKMDFMTWLMRQPDIQSKSLPHFNVLFSSFLADIRNRNIVGSKINHFFNFPMTI